LSSPRVSTGGSDREPLKDEFDDEVVDDDMNKQGAITANELSRA
jgi:hypothetical protein